MLESAVVPKLIQIHDVPDEVHAQLKRRAALEGLSLSGYLRQELERIAGTRSLQEVLAEIRKDPPVVELDEPPEVTIRRMRDAADQ